MELLFRLIITEDTCIFNKIRVLYTIKYSIQYTINNINNIHYIIHNIHHIQQITEDKYIYYFIIYYISNVFKIYHQIF